MHACARVVMAVDALSAGLVSEPVGAASVVRPVCLEAVGAARTVRVGLCVFFSKDRGLVCYHTI
jgi:hypothetical protein